MKSPTTPPWLPPLVTRNEPPDSLRLPPRPEREATKTLQSGCTNERRWPPFPDVRQNGTHRGSSRPSGEPHAHTVCKRNEPFIPSLGVQVGKVSDSSLVRLRYRGVLGERSAFSIWGFLLLVTLNDPLRTRIFLYPTWTLGYWWTTLSDSVAHHIAVYCTLIDVIFLFNKIYFVHVLFKSLFLLFLIF